VTELQNHQLIHLSASAEWFTPHCYIKAAREVLGAIDLDPASCEAANRIVQARCYFTAADNGYEREWHGRIFLNPPYGHCWPNGRQRVPAPGKRHTSGISAQGHWAKRLIEQYQEGLVTEAIVLINANTGEQWFQPLWDFPICFVNHRIRFIPGEGADTRKQPTKSNAFVYFGPRPERFTEVFRQFGRVILPEVLMIAPLQGCVVCGAPFTARRGARTCSSRCRQKSYRSRVTDKGPYPMMRGLNSASSPSSAHPSVTAIRPLARRHGVQNQAWPSLSVHASR
jgi:hypothetical protein